MIRAAISSVVFYGSLLVTKTVLAAMAKTIEDAPARFVHVGSAGGEAHIELPGAVLRSSAVVLMGSGVGSVSRSALPRSIGSVFDAVEQAGLKIAIRVAPLCEVEAVWEKATGKPRGVFTIS